jgi:diaminopropionate ammonia-lyase
MTMKTRPTRNLQSYRPLMFLNLNRSPYVQIDRDRIGQAHAAHVRSLLETCPAHRPTPLVPLPRAAADLGVARVDVKAEWNRMGLTSFKALGGGYAVALLVMARAGAADLRSPAVKSIAAGITVICASAGNHGLAVAAAARAFGARAVVILSETVPEIFAHRLRDKGATIVRAGATYEDSMALAVTMAEQKGWHLVSDSASPGNTETPLAVMQGYTVLLEEAADDLACPSTHVFVQAGVGGLAASAAAYLRDRWGEDFKFIVVEPEGAPCLLESARQGRPTRVIGAPTKLGRLDCKEPSLIAFDLLARLADAFMLVSDAQAEEAATSLAREGAPVSPCGAAGAAGLVAACRNAAWRKQLGLDANSRVLLIGTEA